MEPVRSKYALLQAIAASGLFSEVQFKAARFTADDDEPPDTIALHFVELGWLTQWQAEHLLAGRAAFQVGGCDLQDYLGRGRMGLVFRAVQRSTGRSVAIKIMKKELLNDERSVKRFLREIQLVGRTNHPNIVTAFDAGQLRDGRYYLVTEYVPGRDLSKWLAAEQPLPIAWACECAYQALLGLQHAADKGLIHRDVKPSNLAAVGATVAELPSLKVLDLGLGRFTCSESEEGDLTRDGYTLGTFEFASPEQIRDARRVDIRADIYSLGTTLFQILTGRLPFEGESPINKLTAKFTQEAPLASDLRRDIPPALAQVVARMMHREPDQRPRDPNAAAAELLPFTMSRETKRSATGCLKESTPAPASSRRRRPIESTGGETNSRRHSSRDGYDTMKESSQS